MAAFDLNTIYESSDGMDLLSSTLVEHERLLWELEHATEESQPDTIHRLQLVKAQILLFERLMIGERIDSLMILVNHYAEILSTPQVEL